MLVLLLTGCTDADKDALSDLRNFTQEELAVPPAQADVDIPEAASDGQTSQLSELLRDLEQGRFKDPFQNYARSNHRLVSANTNADEADCIQAPPESYCIKEGLISLNYTDADLRGLLQQIAYAAGANILISDEVEGKITLNLRAVSWQEALQLVMTNKNLASHSSGGVLLVGPAAAITEQQQAALLQQTLKQQLAPLETEYIQIFHAKAAEVSALLTGASNTKAVGKNTQPTRPLLSERGHLLVDARTNGIILTDIKERFTLIKKLLAEIDKPVRQVMVEARIVTANTNFSRQMGVSWGAGSLVNAGLANPLAIGGSRAGLANLRAGSSIGSGGLVIDLGAPTSAGANFAVGLIGGRFMLDLELSALISEGEGDVVARPKIVTADKQSATIISGVEVPFQENSTSGATSTSFKRAVMSLEVLPHITPDNRISMDLKISQDSIGGVVGNTPLINTNQITTKVLVQDGQTVVLGGVYRLSQSKTITKTPLLGDIPIIRLLFRRVRHSKEKQELLIFITPKIIKDEPVDPAPETNIQHNW